MRDIRQFYHVISWKVHYSVGNLVREAPYRDGGGALWVVPTTIAMSSFVWWLLPRDYALLYIVESLTFLKASDYLHDQFHIKAS